MSARSLREHFLHPERLRDVVVRALVDSLHETVQGIDEGADDYVVEAVPDGRSARPAARAHSPVERTDAARDALRRRDARSAAGARHARRRCR